MQTSATAFPDSASQAQRPPLPATLNFLAPSVVPDLIRLGNWADGGYVVPYDAVAQADALLAFGINRDWSFEENFHAVNPSATIHGYDHTISLSMFRQEFTDGIRRYLLGGESRAAGQRFWLWREFHAFFCGRARHFQEKIAGDSSTPGTATVDDAFARLPATLARIFMKIDIEGSEYAIIDSLVSHAGRIAAVAIEFHQTESRRQEFCSAVKSMQTVFDIVHVHGNNCAGISPDGLPHALEVTFSRKAGGPRIKRRSLPIAIDRPNSPAKPDYRILFS